MPQESTGEFRPLLLVDGVHGYLRAATFEVPGVKRWLAEPKSANEDHETYAGA